MKADRAGWTLGLIYINPEDERVFVTLPCKLGLALNFGNPRAVGALCRIWIVVLVALFACPILAHPAAFTRNPATPAVWLAAWAAALLAIRLNPCFGWMDYRLLFLASYGLVATSAGFGVQAVIAVPLVAWWGGMEHLSWVHGLALGPLCGAAQTFGKWAAILLLLKVRPGADRAGCIRFGLLVGLGFTLTEIAALYFPAAWAQATLGWLSLWERTSVSVFHIYSAGLVALAVCSKRHWLTAFVVLTHGVMDGLVVAVRPLQIPFETLEMICSILAVLTWAIFLMAVHAPPVRTLQIRPANWCRRWTGTRSRG